MKSERLDAAEMWSLVAMVAALCFQLMMILASVRKPLPVSSTVLSNLAMCPSEREI